MTVEFSKGMIRTYYVVFDKKRHAFRRWWQLFTGKTFFHCFLITPINDNSCVKIEPLLGGIDVTVMPIPVEQYVAAFAEGDVTAIVSYTVNTVNLDGHSQRGLISCVSLAKALLWLKKSRLTLTPFQLYKLLLKKGGVPIKAYTPYINHN